MAEKLIPLSAVLDRTGNPSAATIWRLRKRNAFPEPVSISPNRKMWRETDIDSWIASRTGTPPIAA